MDGQMIPTGIYQHYKGKHYRVIGTPVHTETREQLVNSWWLTTMNLEVIGFGPLRCSRKKLPLESPGLI